MKNRMTYNSAKVPSKVIVACCILLCSVTLVTYAPALRSGFRFVDDYTYLYWAGTMPLPQYLEYSWAPWAQVFNFRPLRRTLVLFEYYVFRSEASFYHLVQILIHLGNAFLVWVIIWRMAKRWCLAFWVAMFFAVFSIASEAVFWISDEFPLATFFSLVSVLFWITYLENRRRWNQALAIGALVLAFLSKESSVIVPAVLFLIDRLLIRERARLIELVRRYWVIGVITLGYLIIEYSIQRQGMFVVVGGYSLGAHVFANYVAYLVMSFFPLKLPVANIEIVSVLGILLFLIAILQRNILIAFLIIIYVLAIGPVVLSPQGAYGRYLYMAMIPMAIFWSLVLDSVVTRWNCRWIRVGMAVAFMSIVVLNATEVAHTIAQLSEIERQKRVPFRDIMQQYRIFPPGTRLFLIEPPFDLATPELAGMFFLRYGPTVSLGSTYDDGRIYTGGILRSERARLREYPRAYVYYFDQMNRPVEIPVDYEALTSTNVDLPCLFAESIRLDGYELTSVTLKKGQPWAVILYWSAIGKIEKDYSVFVHLVDAKGEIISSNDSYPRNGEERTSLWYSGRFTVDAHVLEIPWDAPSSKDYRLEVGLYYLPTMERLMILQHNGVITDHVTIRPIMIVE